LPVQDTPLVAAHVELARNNCSAGYSSGSDTESQARRHRAFIRDKRRTKQQRGGMRAPDHE
jgi:hypothetical protein